MNFLLFVDNDNRINRIYSSAMFVLLVPASNKLRNSLTILHAEPRHVYLSPTCLIYWNVQRQVPNILYILILLKILVIKKTTLAINTTKIFIDSAKWFPIYDRQTH